MYESIKNLSENLKKCIIKNNTPGAQISIYHKGKLYNETAGVLNQNTKINVTEDSVFMIGSITKVFTGVLLMQLVDKELINLDDPVNEYLPEVKIDKRPLPDSITVRMLLNHTSGIDGDFFIRTGWNEDAIEKYMSELTRVGYLHPSGVMRSYCNAAYSMAGRIIEKINGKHFNDVLQEKLLEPIDIIDAVLAPEEFLKYSSAIGHDSVPGSDKLALSRELVGPRGTMPAGTLLSMSAKDLIKFGKLHISNGISENGKKVLSKEGIKALQRPVENIVPEHPACEVWAVEEGSDMKLYNHYGGTAGQNSWLGVIPEKELAIAVLTNSQAGAFHINMEIIPDILKELVGFEQTLHRESEVEEEVNIDPKLYTGNYNRFAMNIRIIEKDGHLEISVDDSEKELNLGIKEFYKLKPLSKTRFLIEEQELLPTPLSIEFFFWEEEVAQTLLYFGRAHKKETKTS